MRGSRLVVQRVGLGGKEDLHDPRRVIWEIRFIFLALTLIPSAILSLFLRRLGLFLRIVGRITVFRITNLTQRHPAGQYLLLNLCTDHFHMALDAGSGGE